MSTVRIVPGNHVGTYKVEIDGREIGDVVHRLTVDIEHRNLPTVELELLAGAIDIEIDGADVTIDPETTSVLERLGWTPPPGSTS